MLLIADGGLHGSRQQEFRCSAHLHAKKTLHSNSNNLERHPVDGEFASHNVRIAPETTFPPFVTDHCNRAATDCAIVAPSQQSSGCGVSLQGLEIIAGD